VLALSDLGIPSIAAVNGPVIGAGVNLPLACDVILASPKARFDPRFMDIAIHPGGGHLWRMERLVGRQATAALVLFGEALTGEEAARVGLAWRCLDDDELLTTAVAMARRAADRPRELVGRAKSVLDASLTLDTWREAFELEFTHQVWSMEQPEFKAGVEQLRAKLQKD
jgi:enoyl-CoA hydratase